MSDRLAGKVAIVTGGASGIGLAIAKAFGAEGARVCVADVVAEKCAVAAAAVGHQAFGQAVDVRQLASINALVAGVVAHAGGVDILVNCAGVFGMQVFTDISESEFDRIIGVNLRGTLFMMQAVARQLIAQKRGGTIVNIASGTARRASPAAACYSASKAGIVSITQSAALELIPHGIRVNAIAPGAVLTPMWEIVEQQFAKALGTDVGTAAQASQVGLTPIGRMSRPEEYAGAAIYLASAESSFVVGQTLNVDGGLYLN
jgi:NAD(P)-dependent dehydrogenase (short-subunit alcohol dehydrogenase family)